MCRLISLFIAILFLITPYKADAQESGYTEIAKSDKENITLFAKELNGLYYDFKIDFKGKVYSRPFWMNVTNPTYAPQISYEDINGDQRKELIIILTKGYGTGLLEQDVFVFHIGHKRFEEVLVDQPLAIVNKNIKTRLTPEKAEITIGDKHYFINVKELKLLPGTLFEEISLTSIIKYEVRGNQLIATLHPQLSPGAFAGSIIISYEYRDKMYQARSIDFILDE